MSHHVYSTSPEPLNHFFLPNLVWWCFMMRQCVMRKSWFTIFNVKVTVRACIIRTPQWGAADAEIKVQSGENAELKRAPFKACSRSVYSHTCYTYCQGFLPYLFLPFRSIHLHFFQDVSRFFSVLAVADTSSCVGPQNKIGHPAGCRFPSWVPA